tara:strand:+ start:82 stop:771 length:690 start_codon:yes stop_codon:yes gene_type:complete
MKRLLVLLLIPLVFACGNDSKKEEEKKRDIVSDAQEMNDLFEKRQEIDYSIDALQEIGYDEFSINDTKRYYEEVNSLVKEYSETLNKELKLYKYYGYEAKENEVNELIKILQEKNCYFCDREISKETFKETRVLNLYKEDNQMYIEENESKIKKLDSITEMELYSEKMYTILCELFSNGLSGVSYDFRERSKKLERAFVDRWGEDLEFANEQEKEIWENVWITAERDCK